MMPNMVKKAASCKNRGDSENKNASDRDLLFEKGKSGEKNWR